MDRRGADAVVQVGQESRFALAPPRHFLLPALLLLLSEEPGHGYNLAKGLDELRFGRVDRASVYRALGQLERDGLVESWSATPTAGQARRVYGLTAEGERALRAWMGVIKQERDGLDLVLRRYAATGTVDAALAEAEGGWAAVTGHAWSSVSASSRIERHRGGLRTRRAGRSVDDPPRDDHRDGHRVLDDAVCPPATRRRFTVVPDRSAVLIEARSTVGPITFGAVGVRGTIEAELHGGVVRPGTSPSAHLEIDVTELRSGNRVYDAELLRRIDARRHPLVALDLRRCTPVGSSGRFHVDGEVTLHGLTRPIQGTVSVVLPPEGRLVVSGEQVFDIRDFDIASPTVLMLRIYPDVIVQLQVEALPVPGPIAGPNSGRVAGGVTS